VFTTRIDTIFGATFMMLAPEHGLVNVFAKESEDEKAFLAKAQRFRAQDRAGRMTGEVQKEGFFTGRFAINPFTNLPMPIWVANYVLGEYGTGAVMGVPAHDERDFDFAQKYELPIVPVIVRHRAMRRRGHVLRHRTTTFCSTRASTTACRPSRRSR
jgi:leucyl-tRNA synthetase